MKHLICIALLCLSTTMFAQSKYLTKTGTVGFEASVPSFEEVKATNSAVTAVINTDNGEFAALVLVKGFRFKNALMEEHFNENYAESDTYPKASFKGKIKDFELSKLTNQSQNFKISGALTFHGKTNQFNDLDVKISKDNEIINISGNFKTLASNFDIKIPKIVRNKIAEDVLVTFNFKLIKK
ncbi:YceI family protein [Seonamhaeicola aphaedonensis]|uniref:YceI-like domain-containing protein n=1 Tax=Seonamhaeicola aphaedonensis TaxID=1461338 RepID=A0A3D9HAE7_9FLAO|nr:YceI family protein [Seonamhaeicola aphaedonensis]RED45936.1 YceI-like domain-containing protein [Seonamhaeicola aphaedonensis]